MSDEIVERMIAELREQGDNWPAALVELERRAADLIERLQAEKAEMEKLREQNTALSDALDYLRGLTPQQYEALHKDAARYRWLRVHSTGPSEGWSTHSNPESFDAAIDAALEGK